MNVRLLRDQNLASISSYIWTSACMLNACRMNGHRGFVDLGPPALLYNDGLRCGENKFAWGFLQPQITQDECYSSPYQTWTWEKAEWRQHCPVPFDLPSAPSSDEAILALQAIVPHVLKFNDEILSRAKALFSKYNLNPGTTIAVAHRGTDKALEAAPVLIEKYIPVISNLLGDSSLTVWTQTEESETSETLLQRYAARCVRMPEFFQCPSASKSMADWLSPKGGYEKAMDAMTMLCMFSQCKYLLKNTANLADLAAGLSKGKVVHIL